MINVVGTFFFVCGFFFGEKKLSQNGENQRFVREKKNGVDMRIEC